jgi:phage terminase small subunit
VALTAKRRTFAEEYLKDFNATAAAMRVGYSERTARQRGYILRHTPEVEEYIKARIEECAMTAEEVLLRLAEQARAKHTAYLRPDGTFNLERLIGEGKAHLVKGTKWDAQGNLVVEFHDAQSALQLLGKHLKLFAEQVEHSGPGGGPIKAYVAISPDDWDSGTDAP